jgi:hypothetical protein
MFDIIKQPLQFYDSLTKQQVNQSGFLSYQNIFLVSPNDRFIPFVIYRATAATTLTVNLVSRTATTDITANITIQKKVLKVAGVLYDYFRYFSNDALSANIDESDYYLHITDGTLNWYSEWFNVLSNYATNLVKYEYWNTKDIYYSGAYYLFQDSFKFRIYFPGFIKNNSEYKIYERLVTTFSNETIKTYQKKSKIYTLVSPINSFIGDSLELSEMCDNIWVTNQQSETSKITIEEIKKEEVSESDVMDLQLQFTAGYIERGNLDENAIELEVFLNDERANDLVDENGNYLIE